MHRIIQLPPLYEVQALGLGEHLPALLPRVLTGGGIGADGYQSGPRTPLLHHTRTA